MPMGEGGLRVITGCVTLFRQHQLLAVGGITVNRRSLSQWANRAVALLQPVHDAQRRSALESAVIQMDETPIWAGRHPGKLRSMKHE